MRVACQCRMGWDGMDALSGGKREASAVCSSVTLCAQVLATTERGTVAEAVESGAHRCTVDWAVGAWESYAACEGDLGDRLETLWRVHFFHS